MRRHHRKLHRRYGRSASLEVLKRLQKGALKAAHKLALKIKARGGKVEE